MGIEEQFANILQSYQDNIKEIAFETRSLIYETFPKVIEVVWEKQKT